MNRQQRTQIAKQVFPSNYQNSRSFENSFYLDDDNDVDGNGGNDDRQEEKGDDRITLIENIIDDDDDGGGDDSDEIALDVDYNDGNNNNNNDGGFSNNLKKRKNPDDDDDNVNSTNNSNGRGRKKITAKSPNSNLKLGLNLMLPGGSARVMNTAPSAGKNVTCLGEAPRQVVRQIRKYMDILFNSLMFEAKYIIVTSTSERSSAIQAIPGVVSAILEYNNIAFCTIKSCLTKMSLVEPIWYQYDVEKSELILFINEGMYEEYCSKHHRLPVNFTSGIIPIEIFNPQEERSDMLPIELSMVLCAVACDHVAQHIITDMLGPTRNLMDDIHYRYTETGTTLHSIFRITRYCSRATPRREIANFITLGRLNTNTTTSQLLKPTRQILDNLIPSRAFASSNTSNFATSNSIYGNGSDSGNIANFAYSL